MLAGLILAAGIWVQPEPASLAGADWRYVYNQPWMPRFGISLSLAMDGLSLLMIVLTFFLGSMAVLVSWNEIQDRTGFYYFNLLFVLGELRACSS